jgi:hypothetical protein
MSKQVECFFWFLSKIEFVFYLFTSRAIRLALDSHGQAENNGNKEVHDDQL